MNKTLRFALAAPLALALAACNSSGGEGGEGSIEGEPVAAVPAPEGKQWVDVAVQTPDGGTLVGNPDAPIKLMEYGSLTCPGCAQFAVQSTESLMNDYVNSGRVSFELRQFAIHGPPDLILGRLTHCSTPEAVIPLSDQVWRNFEQTAGAVQPNMAALEQAMQLPIDQRFVAAAEALGYLDFFAARGISEDQARECLADVPSIEAAANNSQKYGTEFNITGTPTFLINGQKQDAGSWQEIEPLLQRAGAR